MYIIVRLLNGFQKPLTYRVPEAYRGAKLVGRIVQVPLRNRLVYGLVCQQCAQLDTRVTFKIRDLQNLGAVPNDEGYTVFVERVARHYAIDRITLLKRLQHFLDDDKPHAIDETLFGERVLPGPVVLTPEQQNIYAALAPALDQAHYVPALIYGVTGSGKTEVYKKLIARCCEQSKTAVVLFPEVSMALQFARHFKDTLEVNAPVYSFHSGSSKKEKEQVWSALLVQTPIVLVGVHMPILLPISNLGLIIVDEEHEVGYQEKKHPKLNTKDIALMRAQQYEIPIILGSATPSIASLYQVKTGRWQLFELTQRYTGAFPSVRVVSLTKERRNRRNFWISKELERELALRLERGEQSILFINRRGLCFFVQCEQCAHIIYCPHCSVSLTLHHDQRLHCHYCGVHQPMPVSCPACRHMHFLRKGIGTQQVVGIVQELFKQARVARADLDITSKKQLWQQTMADFLERRIDILVGTQTITKGYHFPGVTLVGILWADLNVHFPVFNAAETTLQQLIQVAGRAGRASQESTVIVQTMADHPIYRYLNERDYINFYANELANRQVLGYPPCGRLVELEVVHSDEPTVIRDAHVLASWLMDRKSADMTVLGPAKPLVSKIKNTHRRTLSIKAPHFAVIMAMYEKLPLRRLASRVYCTPNPLT